MFKYTMVHPYHGILLSHEKGQTTDIHNLDGAQEFYAKWKKPISKIIDHMIPFIKESRNDKLQ